MTQIERPAPEVIAACRDVARLRTLAFPEGENAGRALGGEQYVSFEVRSELETRGYRFV